jgi:hypothetical protein
MSSGYSFCMVTPLRQVFTTCTTVFNNHKLCVVPTQCIYVLHTILTINSINQLFFVIQTQCVGFQVLTAVIMNSSTFRDITPCSPIKFNGRLTFNGPHCVIFQNIELLERQCVPYEVRTNLSILLRRTSMFRRATIVSSWAISGNFSVFCPFQHDKLSHSAFLF